MQVKYHEHLGVYAVIIDENKILLIKKGRGPYIGLLDLPGGSIELSESLDNALNREIKEEVGCDITYYTQLGACSTYFKYKRRNASFCLKHIGILYKVLIKGNPKLEGDNKDSLGCIWIGIEHLENMQVTPMVIEAIKIFKSYNS